MLEFTPQVSKATTCQTNQYHLIRGAVPGNQSLFLLPPPPSSSFLATLGYSVGRERTS